MYPPCERPSCPACQSPLATTYLERVKQDPFGATEEVFAAVSSRYSSPTSSDGNTSALSNEHAALFHAIMCSTPADSRLRHCDIHHDSPGTRPAVTSLTLYIQHILNGRNINMPLFEISDDPYFVPPCHWELPVQGIIHYLEPILVKKETLQPTPESECPTPACLTELRAAWREIFDIIWFDLNDLLPATPGADFKRSLVTQLIRSCSYALDLRPQFRRNKAIVALATHCWANMSTNPVLRGDTLRTMHLLFSAPGHELTVELAIKAVSLDVIVRQSQRLLSSPTLIDDNLYSELFALHHFSGVPDGYLTSLPTDVTPFSKVLVSSNICVELSTAVVRQLKEGTIPRTIHVIRAALLTIWPILAPQHVEGMIYMLEHSSMLDVAVRGLIFDEKLKTRHWHIFFTHLTTQVQVSACPGPCTCYKRFIPTLIRLTRAGVERLYCFARGVLLDHIKSEIPTYNPTTDPEPTSDALEIWDALAHALNITEKGLRVKWRQEKQCGNARCLKRGKIGGEDVEKKLRHVCRRCSSVWYCGKECQREDWKAGHKIECERA